MCYKIVRTCTFIKCGDRSSRPYTFLWACNTVVQYRGAHGNAQDLNSALLMQIETLQKL